MRTKTFLITGVIAGAARSLPRMCGPTSRGMVHVMIGVHEGMIHAHAESVPGGRVDLLRFPGESYSGAAAVLNETWYSSRYGWMADGFISLGDGEGIWIENIARDAGLGVYEGGMRMMRHMHTYGAIFGTDGSDPGRLERAMRHDWFSATGIGEYDATFRITVRDAAGRDGRFVRLGGGDAAFHRGADAGRGRGVRAGGRGRGKEAAVKRETRWTATALLVGAGLASLARGGLPPLGGDEPCFGDADGAEPVRGFGGASGRAGADRGGRGVHGPRIGAERDAVQRAVRVARERVMGAPVGGFVYIECIESSPGLLAYAGRAFGPYAFMDPLFGTAGSSTRMIWDGVMLHNYSAVTAPGHYAATYRVYFGDSTGAALPGYEAGEITLGWVWATDCPADLAEPFGVLDLMDITAFVSAFVAGHPAADLAEPTGVFDLADVIAFAEAFAGGCP